MKIKLELTMLSKFKIGLFITTLLIGTSTAHATKRKVLFIGNSYTYTNNMPLMLQNMAAAMGDTLVYDESDPGGYTFALHCTNTTTISKIFSQNWDIVVLQEQSELPSFPPTEVDTEVYPYAHKLDSMIHANDSCTQTLFLMTWGHANGDPPNCGFYPVICTYAGMQQRLRESYLQMTQDNYAIVAPVGMAWKKVMDSIPSIWLYISDSSHPVIPGSYLETAVLYSSIFHKKTSGCTYTDGLSTLVAGTLQHVSDKVVFDSLDFWQQYGHYPYAGFSWSVAGSNVTYTGHSPVSAGYYWNFGDGTHDTATNPLHTYGSSGNYVVSHTVATDCFTETLVDTVHLGTTGLEWGSAGAENTVVVLNGGRGNITLLLPDGNKVSQLEVFDVSGRCVRKYSVSGNKISDNLNPGIYIYRSYSAEGIVVENRKMVVY